MTETEEAGDSFKVGEHEVGVLQGKQKWREQDGSLEHLEAAEPQRSHMISISRDLFSTSTCWTVTLDHARTTVETIAAAVFRHAAFSRSQAGKLRVKIKNAPRPTHRCTSCRWPLNKSPLHQRS